MDGLVWERVVWRQGDGRYQFEVDRGGLHATLTAPHGRSLTIPVVAWYGLLDAISASRRTKARAERAAPTRHGQRWSQVEAEELAAAYLEGAPLEALAGRHNRSRAAIEAQLVKLGLRQREGGDDTEPQSRECSADDGKLAARDVMCAPVF